MWTKRNYTLTETELAAIEQAMHHDQRVEVQRQAQVIHLLHLGNKSGKVAQITAISNRTVYEWHDMWRHGGIEGLTQREGSGRRRKATPEYEAILEDVLEIEAAINLNPALRKCWMKKGQQRRVSLPPSETVT